jgi:hypothetical protein
MAPVLAVIAGSKVYPWARYALISQESTLLGGKSVAEASNTTIFRLSAR